MTEYKKVTSTINGHHGAQNNLEESVSSLLESESLMLPDENKTAKSLYRKCAKLFINRKFVESVRNIQQLADVSVKLFDHSKIEEELFVNIWSLYFNLLDIILNKDEGSVPKETKDELEAVLLSDELFDTLLGLNSIVSPKLVLLLTLIKMNNDKSDLAKLRQFVELYFVHASPTFHESETALEAYYDLLDVYHLHLLVKLGRAEESEYLIRSNPLIRDPELMVEKLLKARKEIEEEKKRKAELQKKKELAAQKRREQRANQLAKEKLHDEIERAKQQSIEKSHKRQVQKRPEGKEKVADLTVIDVIKRRLQALNNTSALVVVFSILSFIFFLQNNRFLMNARVRQTLQAFWSKLAATAQMALRVTYM